MWVAIEELEKMLNDISALDFPFQLAYASAKTQLWQDILVPHGKPEFQSKKMKISAALRLASSLIMRSGRMIQ
eukprot:COSAG01_NODE_16_length_40091_cov_15.728646_28_plen_73_part_00